MRLLEQWREIQRVAGDDWGEARLLLTVADEGSSGRAAALLGPVNPARRGRQVRFTTARRGPGHAPETIRRLLKRLDDEGIEGSLELFSLGKPKAVPAEVARPSLASAWDTAVGALPSDWSDVYAEVELASSDHLERAALLLAPVNPARHGDRPGFRFRAARRSGYGASPGMVRRCLERLDEDGIRGAARILHALSDTRPVATQGPVWYLGGKVV